MNNKKIQAQMQLDVSFIGNTTQLVKQLESLPGKLHLDTAVTKQVGEGFAKSYKSILTNLNKLSEGLSKPGLSPKQYETFFENVNLKIQDTSKQVFTLKKALTDAYKSPTNKSMLKDLETYKKQLAEVNKIVSNQKAAQTRQNTAKNKLKTELGLDYDVAGSMLSNIAARKQNKQDPTPTQSKWLERQGLGEKELARALILLQQIEEQQRKIEGGDQRANAITKKKTAASGQAWLSGQVSNLEANTYSQDELKADLGVLQQMDPSIEAAADALNNKLQPAFESSLSTGITNAEKMAEGMSTLNEVLAQFGIVLSAGTIVRAFKDIAVAAFDFYKSLDSALNEIYIVSNLSSNAVNDLKTNFINMAQDTGMALDDITRSATLFYQQGLNTNEVMEMTRVTSEFAKVAGIDATDAADKLTAAVNGYCLAAEDAAMVADKFNKVAAASAADIDELSTAFSKAAAQANQAGVGMDNYLAYLATMVEATREAPENIGTSLKTIMSRMQQVKMGGTTEDGETDVNQVETALKSVGVQLRDVNGELRDLEDVFAELGPKWNSLDRNTQAYLGTIIAGTRQQSRFITLMQNWDRVLDLADQSANSAGQQALMHAKAMESIESKMQQLKVAWQEFISNIANSEMFKGLIEMITGFVNAINSGSTPVVLLGTSIALLVKQTEKLNGPIGKLFTKIGQGAAKIKGLNVNNLKMAGGFFSSQKKVNGFTASIMKNDKQIKKLQKENSKLAKEQKSLDSGVVLTTEDVRLQSQRFRDNEKQIAKNNDEIKRLESNNLTARNNIKALTPELEAQEEAYNAVQQGMSALSVGLAGLSAILPGLGGDLVAAGSGLVTMASAGLQMASIVTTKIVPMMNTMKVGFITAIKEMDAATQASVIGAILQAIVLLITGAITAVKALVEAFGNQDKKIAESVNKVGDALQNYNNAQTKNKAAEKMVKDYEALSNKVYRTAKEQEELNRIAQELGDSLEIEVIEDQFGNLSLSMEDVNDKMNKLKEEAKKARKELIDAEQEAIEEYDHNGNVDKFYDEYLKSHKSDIRSAMSDIETGIDTKDLATSANNVQAIMTNLKNNVIENSSEMVEAFGGAGVHWSLTEDVESMMDAFNNADIDSSKWNELYRTFDTLQSKVDSMSYDQALEVVGSAIQSWGEAAGLTAEQVDLMKDSIMDSLYSDSQLHKTVSGYDEQLAKMDGSYFTKQLADYEKEKDRLYREADNNGEWDLWNPFNESDQEREYEVQQNKISILKDEQEAYEKIAKYDKEIAELEEMGLTNLNHYNNLLEKRDKLAKEYGAATREEMQRMETLRSITGKLSDNSADWFNKAGLLDENAFGLLEQMDKSGELDSIIGAYTKDEKQGTRALTDYLVNVINNTDDEEMKKIAQEKLNNVFANIEVRGTMTWNNLHSELDSLSSDLRKMTSLIDEFNEAGGFTLDTFADLCDILDSIDIGAVFDTGAMDQYLGALENLELGFDASTGMITANGDALKSLQDIQMVATQAKLAQTAASLEADKASLQSQIYGVEAEIAANQALIDWLKTQTSTEVKLSDIKVQGEQYYTSAMQEAAVETGKLYQDMTSASKAWAEASLTNAAKLGEGIKAAMSGNLGSGNLYAYMEGLLDGGDISYEKTGSYGQLQAIQKDGKVDVQKAIAELESYNDKGWNTIDKLRAQMKGIEQMQGLLKTMSTSDLSKFGSEADADELERYIGQLKEIYNILNRIQNLEHRLSTLETYSNIAVGEDYGKYYKQRLAFTEELTDQYKFLVEEQKKWTNGYMEFIENSAVADVFDFDEFGQIIIDFEKYNKLQDTAADGEKSLKEQADELYETYTEMYEELQGYFDEYIAYLEKAIELHQEAIDSYVETENKVAEAIKEIYQKILDTKLEAIDREKEALEELREAREQANKDKENAKTISGLQTNIQRAMMDTSGASDISFIKAQQDMNDKLEDIAEDKYSDMLDDIIAQLDEEQEALQDNFDKMFENTEWLFAFIEENIMNDQKKIEEILTQTDEWQQKSNLEREQDLENLSTDFNTYMAAMRGDNGEAGTIYGVWKKLGELKGATEALDKALQTREVKVGAAVANAIAEGIKSATGGSTGTGNTQNPSGSNPPPTTPYNPTITQEDTTKHTETWTLQLVEKDKCTTRTFKAGSSVQLPRLNATGGYTHVGWKLPNGSTLEPGKSYTPTANNQSVTSMWLPTNSSLQPQFNNGLNAFTFPDTRLPGLSTGGMVDSTGVAMLHGSINKPEAVLNALQTEHFMKFTDTLDKIYSQGNTSYTGGSVNIGSIEFNVESMSSVEDGERAFTMFVDKFKEIGERTGIQIDTFKSRL